MRLTILALSALGCGPTYIDTGLADPPFCESLTDGGKTVLEDGSEASAGSGSLHLRVITDQSDDMFDPYYVAYRAFSLEPSETGGVQTTGNTNGDGLVDKTLGEMPWDFEATWTRGSTTCSAVMNGLEIQEGKTTNACVVLTCPEE